MIGLIIAIVIGLSVAYWAYRDTRKFNNDIKRETSRWTSEDCTEETSGIGMNLIYFFLAIFGTAFVVVLFMVLGSAVHCHSTNAKFYSQSRLVSTGTTDSTSGSFLINAGLDYQRIIYVYYTQENGYVKPHTVHD